MCSQFASVLVMQRGFLHLITFFKVLGVISLKRLLNHYILKNWSSKVIKKSLEAYFFTQNTKLYFFKNILKHTNLLALQTCN